MEESTSGQDYAESIDLHRLKESISSELTSMSRFALDIGGSLAKIAYQTSHKCRRTQVCESMEDDSGVSRDGGSASPSTNFYQYSEMEEERPRLCFIKFETRYLETCLNFIRENIMPQLSVKDSQGQALRIKVTGGGAFKHRDMIKETLGVSFDKEDEMECLVEGCVFLLKNISDEAFTYERRQGEPAYNFTASSLVVAPFPFLLVNIGSGVSILEVTGEKTWSRVGGTSLGGGTFWGIGALLTNGKSFDELLEMADKGDHRNIDMLVSDIYGGGPVPQGLASDLIASSFGMAARGGRQFRNEDLLKSLLITVSNNIGQIAYIHAQQRGLKRIIFGGFFIRGHPTTMHTLTYAVNFWSQGEVQAMFLRHEGYLGAIGAFLKSVEHEEAAGVGAEDEYLVSLTDASWMENYCASSALPSGPQSPLSESEGLFDRLELEQMEHHMLPFPLLRDPGKYLPDTWDLTRDEAARVYWLTCFEAGVNIHQQKAYESQALVSSTALERSQRYISKYIDFLHELQANPCAYGVLTVRCMLDAHQNFLREFGFSDPFSAQKKMENEMALACLPNRLEVLSRLDWRSRAEEVVRGMLTGNVFDWGAKEVVDLMAVAEGGVIKFEQAESKLQPRPWLFDDLDSWLERLSRTDIGPHRCALIFVDNSGFDVIMGVIPFAIDCLDRGTKVILAANTGPAINDVTYSELAILVKKLCQEIPSIGEAISTGRLMVCETGQTSPCLDLRCVAGSLGSLVVQEGVDLVVVEGMGRAVHTNLFAQLSCECLKVAVIKNAWLAKHLGGEIFSVVFKYELALS